MKKNTVNFLFLLTITFLVACNWQAEITLTTQVLNEKNERYDFKAKYPQFGITVLDDSISDKVNSYLDRCNKKSAEQVHEEWFRPFEVIISSRESVLENRYVSANMKCYYFAGGAHGTTLNHTFNYDTKAKHFLTIDDVLGTDSMQLVQLVKTRLKDQIGDMNFVDDGVRGVSNLSKFLISDKGLEFIFDPYEVAAYVYGVVSVSVSFDEYPFNVERKD
ncbi:MAG: DUF3298 domain-containing protein [Bacteroidales bacterium]